MDNSKIYIIVIPIILLFIILLTNMEKKEMQTVAPSCFEDEDCRVPLTEGYCRTDFACISGKCYTADIPCPEDCKSFEDEDLDGDISCKDSDCFNNPACACINTEFVQCLPGMCYCEPGTSPKWAVTAEDSYCECV